MSATRRFARFAAQLRPDDIPADVKEMARRCLVDWLGIAITGSRQPLAPLLLETIDQMGGHAQATLVGANRARTSAANAAMCNATFAHAIDYDDVHMPSGVHATAPVWAAALAVAQWKQSSAQEATAAFVAGYEVMVRIGNVAGFAMIQRHFHPTGTLAYFGASVAAGKLLRLDENQMATAIGIACGQAGGLTQVRGTMSKPFFAGHAAHGGVLSAMMAANGFQSVVDALEGSEGVFATFADGIDETIAFDGLGERYELLSNRFKAYAACAVTHPVLDGLLQLRPQIGDVSQVVEIVAHVHPYATEYVNRPDVRTGLAGKFSMQYCAAVVLLDGQAQEAQFTDERAGDARLQALAGRLRMTGVAGMAMDRCEVEVKLADGRSLRCAVSDITGSPARPIPLADLELKFRSLAAAACDAQRVEAMLKALRAWPNTTVDELLELADR
ncbi:MAG: MmgE/PrpD family protein [Pseudomonadota bacterium]